MYLGTLGELADKSGGGDFHAMPSAWMAFIYLPTCLSWMWDGTLINRKEENAGTSGIWALYILSFGAGEEWGQGVDVWGTEGPGERGCSRTLPSPSW